MLSVEFVATPDPDAEVRCALHDPDARVYVADGALDLGVADFQGAPGGVGGEDGYRRITATVTVVSDEWSARRFQSGLARELLRAENWLRVQFDESTPVQWFRTWRTTPGPMDLQAVDAGIWQFTVQVDADAYSVGEMVQQGVSVSNDPTVDGGVAVVLRDTPGDAPAPLIISGIDQGDGTIYRPLIAVTPLSEWSGLQWWKPTVSDAAWSTTGSYVTDSGASGGSALRLKIDGGSNGAPDTAQALVTTTQAGTYRLFARIRGFGAVSSLVAGGAAAVSPVTVRMPTTGNLPVVTEFFYADLGLYVFPRGNAPLEAGYTLAPGDIATITLAITNGASSAVIRVDDIVAVPVDLFEAVGDSRMFLLHNNGLLGQRIYGDQERIGPIPAPNPIVPRDSDHTQGDFPQITPGAVNVLTVLTRVLANADPMSNLSEPLGAVTVLNIKHRPRFLYQASA